MKKLAQTVSLILFLLLFTMGIACKNREANPDSGPMVNELHEEGEYHFTVVKVDGCEYIMLMMDRNHPHEGFGFMAHKGNCRNPIHYYNPEVPYEPTKYDSAVLVGKPIKVVK